MSRLMVSFADLRMISRRLSEHGIAHALGGSGLMHALGIDVTVNDWDITTEAPEKDVIAALADFDITRTPPSRQFPSGYLLRIELATGSADIIGDFAIFANDMITPVPTIITGMWQGIPLGDPIVWARAYEAMGRNDKAAKLTRQLSDGQLGV